MSSSYTVYINYNASEAVTVEADSPEAAIETAYQEARGSLCHQCAAHLTLGDAYSETVTDSATGEEIPVGAEAEASR